MSDDDNMKALRRRISSDDSSRFFRMAFGVGSKPSTICLELRYHMGNRVKGREIAYHVRRRYSLGTWLRPLLD